MTSAASAVVVAACVAAAAVHGYVFVRESPLFSRPSTQRMFEVAAADVSAVRLWAFHQGVYNLLLGATSVAGAIGVSSGARNAGAALIVAASTSMIATRAGAGSRLLRASSPQPGEPRCPSTLRRRNARWR